MAGVLPGELKLDREGAAHAECNEAAHVCRERRIRVLIADDCEDSADSTALLLSLAGFETRVARDGQGALACASEWLPHACVFDLAMPGLDGCELARRLREQSWAESSLLIALTGWTTPENQAEAYRAGFDCYICKPVEPQELVRVIASRACSGRPC